MDQDLKGIISGSVYDAPLYDGDIKFKTGRMPHIGQKVTRRDGREYVFVATYNIDHAAGEIVSVQDCSTTEITDSMSVAAIGATKVIVDITGETLFGNSATLAINRMIDGYLVLTNQTGAGYSYKVKSNTVQDSDDKVTFTLYDSLIIAIDGTTDLNIIGPHYYGVVAGTATLKPVGVAIRPTTAGTNTRWEYFWVQKKGLAAVHVETASGIVIGEQVAAGANAGIIPPGGNEAIVIGVAACPPTANDDTLAVWLDIC